MVSVRALFRYGEFVQHQRVHPIPTDLRGFASRNVDVVLTPALVFHMQEVLDQKSPSHWSHVWPSSVALSRWFMEQLRSSLPDSAKELGCGMGLVSMTLAHLGVQAEGTDREPTALAFAASNAARNAVTGFTATHLDWSEPEGQAAPLVVAADIMYDKESPARVFALLETAGLLLPLGRLIIGGPHARDLLLTELVGRFTDHGYTHVEETRQVDWEGQTNDIDIHVLTRPAA